MKEDASDTDLILVIESKLSQQEFHKKTTTQCKGPPDCVCVCVCMCVCEDRGREQERARARGTRESESESESQRVDQVVLSLTLLFSAISISNEVKTMMKKKINLDLEISVNKPCRYIGACCWQQ